MTDLLVLYNQLQDGLSSLSFGASCRIMLLQDGIEPQSFVDHSLLRY